MRTNQVVALAKVIELALAVFEGGEVEVAQNFELERAMEALVFALGLRVISPTMSDADAEPNSHRLKAVKGWSWSEPQGAPLSISIAAGNP